MLASISLEFSLKKGRTPANPAGMPTVLRQKGYRIGFYMGDRSEPPHVHVVHIDGRSAKFWIPAQLARNLGLRSHELREVLEILLENETLILEKWNEYFGR